jgi:anti-sigma regulatory factor (Ser/Thr protein kinase)
MVQVFEADDAGAARADRVVTSWPPEPSSVTGVRRWVKSFCNGASYPETICDDAELVVSELVGNAVRHSGTVIHVEVATLRALPGMWLCVRDESTRPVKPRDADLLAEGGRGLQLVDFLASRWGVDADADGKRVWAEVC